MTRVKQRAAEGRGDRGVAMIAAVVCLLVIVTLSAVAVQQSVGGLSSFAQGRKLLQTFDAAEAGLQSEISAIQHWLSSPTSTLPCQGGSSVSGLPSGVGWNPAGASSSDSVVNTPSLGYYSLSLATYTIAPTGSPSRLPASAACYNNAITKPAGTAWYVIAQSQGATAATTGGTTSTGRTLQALLWVHNYSTAAIHRHGPSGPSANRVQLVGFYSSGSTTYTSNASSQAISLSPVTSSPTVAAYSGYGAPDPNVVSTAQPSTSILTGQTWLSAGVLAQYAEADSSGSSKACAGLVASPGTIQLGTANPSCSPSGSPGSTGVKLDLSTIPGVGSAISSLADVTLETTALTSAASMGTGGSPVSGSANLGNLSVKVTLPLGLSVTLGVSIGTGANQNLMSAVTSAITGDALILGPVTSTLVSALSSALALTSNYQTNVAGVFSVSAIHVTVLTNLSSGDLAVSTVGPNTVTASTTTTTVPSTTTTLAPTTTTVPSTTTTTLPSNGVSIVWIRQVA